MNLTKTVIILLLVLLAGQQGCTEFGYLDSADVADGFSRNICSSDDDCEGFGPSCAELSFCTNAKFCDFKLSDSHCLINGTCVTALATSKDAPCSLCDPARDQFAFSEVECGAGEFCESESGACVELPDQINLDIVPDAAPECPLMGCCESVVDCPQIVGACSLVVCDSQVCSESSMTGACFRGLHEESRCGQMLAVNNAAQSATPSQWTVQQPQDAWVFKDGFAEYSQQSSAGGQYAGIFGPNFSMYGSYCQPSESEVPVPLIVQVEHQGTLVSALPEVKVRPLNDLNWIDLEPASLPSHPEAIPDFSEHVVPAEAISMENQKFNFQVALEARLSPIVQQGQKKVYSIRVATGSPPEWQVDQSEPIVINVNDPPHLFFYATDPDSSNSALAYEVNNQLGKKIFQVLDMTTLYTGVVTKPYEKFECRANAEQEGSWALDCEDLGSLSIEAANQPGNELGDEERWGVLLRFKDNLSENDMTAVLDVLDREKSGGLRDRMVLNFQLRSLPVCGDGVVSGVEECDVVGIPTIYCDENCGAFEVAPVDSVDLSQGIDVDAIPASNGVAFLWHEAASNSLWIRTVDLDSSQDMFMSEPINVAADLASGQHTEGRLASLKADRVGVVWTHTEGGQAHVRASLFSATGQTIHSAFKPYPEDYEFGDHLMPDISVMDGTKGAVVWVDRWTPDGSVVEISRLVLNAFDLQSANLVGSPIPVMQDLGVECSSPRVVRLNEDPTDDTQLFLVWKEKVLADSTTRIRFAVYDHATQSVVVGPEVVDSAGPNVLAHPDVVRVANGKIAVVWEKTDETGPNGADVAFRLYDSSAAALGEGQLVPGENSGNQLRPIVASADQDGLLVLWQTQNSETQSFDIHGRYGLSLANTSVWVQEAAEESAFNSYKDGQQTHPAATALTTSGMFAVFWLAEDLNTSTTQVRFRVLKASSIQP